MLMANPGEIDPVKYGVLWQKVDELERKVDRLERNSEQLLELANKSKGGLWMGMGFVSAISSAVGYFLHWINK